MKKLLTSKIFYVQVIGILIPVVALFAETYPKLAVSLGLAISILTIILRALQGTSIEIGGKAIKL